PRPGRASRRRGSRTWPRARSDRARLRPRRGRRGSPARLGPLSLLLPFLSPFVLGQALLPPPPVRVVPVTYEASSDVRNRTHAATSSGVPTRRAGIASTTPIPTSWVNLVSTKPGATRFRVPARVAP